jgi:trimeric autotransporter adhesin
MAVYNQVLTYTFRDSLASGNPQKIIFGAYLDGEFGAIHTASLDAVSLSLNNTIAGNNSFTGTNTFSGTSITTTFAGKVAIGAPASGIALTTTAASATAAAMFTGTDVSVVQLNSSATTNRAILLFQQAATSKARVGVDGTQSVLSDSVNGDLCFSSNGGSIRFGQQAAATQVSLSSAGNIVINPPSSGNTLNMFGVANSYTLQIAASTTSNQSLGVNITAGTTTSDVAFRVQNATGVSNYFEVRGDGTVLAGFSGAGFTIVPAGNVTVGTPTSGTALTVTGISGSSSLTVGANSGAASAIVMGWNVGVVSNAWNIFTQSTDPFAIGTANATTLTLATNSTARVTVNSAGNVTVNAPSSSNALTTNAVAGAYSISAIAPNTASSSFGMLVTAGTNSSDYAINVNNAANTLTTFRVRGDGVIFGNDGTNLFELGYKGTPINAQAGSYTLAASDKGKGVHFSTAGSVCTVPSGVFVAGDVVTVAFTAGSGTITVVQGTSQTNFWANGSGATSGTRTLTGIAVATLIFQSSTQAMITGSGVS